MREWKIDLERSFTPIKGERNPEWSKGSNADWKVSKWLTMWLNKVQIDSERSFTIKRERNPAGRKANNLVVVKKGIRIDYWMTKWQCDWLIDS